jgi:hypothetical protein
MYCGFYFLESQGLFWIISDLSVITSHLDWMAGSFRISRGALLKNSRSEGVPARVSHTIISGRSRLDPGHPEPVCNSDRSL